MFLAFYRFEKYRMEHENEMFPDEVDTPQDVSARVRFQRYKKAKLIFQN